MGHLAPNFCLHRRSAGLNRLLRRVNSDTHKVAALPVAFGLTLTNTSGITGFWDVPQAADDGRVWVIRRRQKPQPSQLTPRGDRAAEDGTARRQGHAQRLDVTGQIQREKMTSSPRSSTAALPAVSVFGKSLHVDSNQLDTHHRPHARSLPSTHRHTRQRRPTDLMVSQHETTAIPAAPTVQAP
jgi:hypothetical protein